jgi:hypothetical protein
MNIPKQIWPAIVPPNQKSIITVADVLNADIDEERINMIKNWTKSVWENWSHSHEWIRQKTKEFI